MLFRRSHGLTKLVEEGYMQTEEIQVADEKREDRKKKRKKKKKKKIIKPLSEESETPVEQFQSMKRSSISSIWTKNFSKKGFVGLEESECSTNSVSPKKGYLGFGKSNQFFASENQTQPLQSDNKQEQELESDQWNAEFDEFPDDDEVWENQKTTEKEEKSAWNHSPSGFKYRVGNTQTQEGQNVEQWYLQSPPQSSAAFGFSPLANDSSKLWGSWKKKKNKSLFDDDWPSIPKSGISFFSPTRSKYQAMPKSQTPGKFSGIGLDGNRPPETGFFSRLRSKAKNKIKERGEDAIKKQGYSIPDSESSSNDFSDQGDESLSNLKNVTKGLREVVLERENSADTDSSSSSDESESTE